MKSFSLSLSLFCLVSLLSSCTPRGIQPQPSSSNGNSNSSNSNTGQSSIKNTTQLKLQINDFNSALPEDILEEVEYYGGLGGGEWTCPPEYKTPTFPPDQNNEYYELLWPIEIDVCGLPTSNERVNVTVNLPNGAIKEYTESADNQADLYFHYPSEFSDPIGDYRFIFEGGDWSLEKHVTIHDISKTSLFWDGNQLIFAKFWPSENVRLFAYRNNGNNATLIGWQDIRVDSHGELIININFSGGEFVAIGEKSGEIPYTSTNSRGGWPWQPISRSAPTNNSITQKPDIPFCLGPLPTRLYIGANAEVTKSGMAPQLSLRAQPSIYAEKVHIIAAGRDMVILDGPVCADGSYWWYIRSEQGYEGWSREGDSEDYWIDPVS